MKAKIDNKILKVRVVKLNYNDSSAEVVIEEGNHIGCYAIVKHEDLIKDSIPVKAVKSKLSFDRCDIDYRRTTKMFLGEYTYGWKAIFNGLLLASERTKA
ncbi:hypothetical protein [Lacrimispora sp.]|uniref:hypothetical protein n=1 Tax=Lacrimispora sp. TaxID=2719234 RepID=UPI0029E02226|nr:hypothetical protein [Lacrimispora sp.]